MRLRRVGEYHLVAVGREVEVRALLLHAPCYVVVDAFLVLHRKFLLRVFRGEAHFKAEREAALFGDEFVHSLRRGFVEEYRALHELREFPEGGAQRDGVVCVLSEAPALARRGGTAREDRVGETAAAFYRELRVSREKLFEVEGHIFADELNVEGEEARQRLRAAEAENVEGILRHSVRFEAEKFCVFAFCHLLSFLSAGRLGSGAPAASP